MNRKNMIRFLFLVGVVALAGTVLAYAAGKPFNGGYGMMNGYGGNNGGGYGMMNGYGGNNGGGYGMMGGYGSGAAVNNIDDKAADSDMTASLANATMDKNSNSITYTGKDVKIVMFAGPKEADEKFVIGGVANPTVRIRQGAIVTMEVINKDDEVPHGVLITSANPPFAYMPMMQGGIYPGTFIHPVPAATSAGNPAAQAVFTANQPGTYYYICQYPGHATKGMFGQIIIEQK